METQTQVTLVMSQVEAEYLRTLVLEETNKENSIGIMLSNVADQLIEQTR